MYTIQIGSEEDLDKLHAIVAELIDEDVRRDMYTLFEYGFCEREDLPDRAVENVFNYYVSLGPTEDYESEEEVRRELEEEREEFSASPLGDIFGPILTDVMRYIYTGEGRKEAVEAQQEAVEQEVELELELPLYDLLYNSGVVEGEHYPEND